MTIRKDHRPGRLTIPGVALAASGVLLGGAFALPDRQESAPRPLDILLMGTDERDTISPAERRKYHAGGQACGCTDMLMLVHVSARRDRVSVVSLPRDTYAQIPAYRDESTGKERPAHGAKLNAAFQEGGPELTVHTVEAMTGVTIDRYLRVDFRRFIDAVNQTGGVQVCTPRRLKDKTTKLDLKPGKHRLNGGRALQYVRSRKMDTSADLGRIQRQQRFLVNALREVQTRKLLADPQRTTRLMRTLVGAGPQGASVRGLAGLAAELRRVPASATEFATVPIARYAPASAGVGSALVWDKKKADALFTKLRRDAPLVKKGTNPKPKDPPGIMGAPAPVRGSAYACG